MHLLGEIGEHNTYKSVIGADLAENGVYAQIRGQRLNQMVHKLPILKTVMSKQALMIKKA